MSAEHSLKARLSKNNLANPTVPISYSGADGAHDPRMPSLKPACQACQPASQSPASPPAITQGGGPLCLAVHPLPSQSWRNSNNVIACTSFVARHAVSSQLSCDAVCHRSRAAATFRGAVARSPLALGISLVACSLKLPHHSLALLCPEFRARI